MFTSDLCRLKTRNSSHTIIYKELRIGEILCFAHPFPSSTHIILTANHLQFYCKFTYNLFGGFKNDS